MNKYSLFRTHRHALIAVVRRIYAMWARRKIRMVQQQQKQQHLMEIGITIQLCVLFCLLAPYSTNLDNLAQILLIFVQLFYF
jgi:hypothetical protein